MTLSASGKVTSLRPWTDPVVPEEITSMTVSADGGTLAFVYYPCRSPGQDIGIIRGGRTTRTWQQSDPLYVDSLSLSADGNELGYTESSINDAGQGGTVRVLNTSAAPGNADAASKPVYTFPARGRAGFVVFGAAFSTMDVSWVTGFNTFHLAGYRFGADGVQGTLFSKTMSGLSIERAGGQLMVFNQSISLYLVDPLTGKATRIHTPWLKAWGISW
jgi:hypothetical protein